MTVTGSRLLFGVAAVLAGTTVLLGVFGLVYNPVLLLAAVPFAAATYFLWSSATGRLDARMRERAQSRGTEHGTGPAGGGASSGTRQSGGRRQSHRGGGDGPQPRDGRGARYGRRQAGNPGEATTSRFAAASVLEVDPEADQSEIRRAFREKARELHPDAPGGDEAAFRRVRTAYERLTEGQ